jgi:hypothetical protein
MLPHFLNLLSRSWDAMIRATGTTTLGFVVWTLLIAAVGWAATIAVKWLKLKRSKTSSPLRAAMRDSIWEGVFTAVGITIVVIAAFCVFAIRTVYDDHQSPAVQSQTLIRLNMLENVEIQKRKTHIYPTEPVFSNMNSLLMAFDIYRHARHGEPCVIWISVPPNATSTLSSEVAQFSNSVSDCFTFGPFTFDTDPDHVKESLTGMIPDSVVFHVSRGDKAGLQLAGQLQGLFKIQVNYEPLPNPSSHYRLNPPVAGKEHIVWLQFGTEVQWNSEARAHQ